MTDIKLETIESEEEPFPYIPKDLYDKLKEIFDIRQLINYVHTRDELMGVQSVINFLDVKFKEQNKEIE